ncbi:MAG: ribosomal protein [Dehalococcoidia bacterium]|nr:ribosomal protein [Dehalococcoidia bacterium]
MGRYTGPVCRICRRVGEKLFLKGDRCLTPKCEIEKRPTPPGDHGAARRRRVSERGVQLREKKRARAIYGVLERQFSKYFDEAARRPGVTGQYLLQLLERRLDNVAFRLGFADSRKQARQLINHGHVTVNGRKVDIASFKVSIGDKVGWRERSKNSEYYKQLLQDMNRRPMTRWLTLDAQAVIGTVTALPEPSDMDLKIDERLIVEFYAR